MLQLMRTIGLSISTEGWLGEALLVVEGGFVGDRLLGKLFPLYDVMIAFFNLSMYRNIISSESNLNHITHFNLSKLTILSQVPRLNV